MSPVVKKLKEQPELFKSLVCVTAQHRQMLDQALELFGIVPEYDLNVMKSGQDLFDITCNVLQGVRQVLVKERPDLVLVHGDTTTTMAAAMAAYYCKVRVGHVEAGLRTHDRFTPHPEEINRTVTGALTDIHFAPTEAARRNLLNEGVAAEAIYVTGNTVVDALLSVAACINGDAAMEGEYRRRYGFLDPVKRLILVAGHWRENFGEGFENICLAMVDIATANPDVEILYPVHLNPNVQEPVQRIIVGSGLANIHLIEPVDYLPFVYLMDRSHFIITDSGGVQEEAPSLGKPVLVMRENTERPEAVEAGTVKLVGTGRESISNSAQKLLDDQDAYRQMSIARNPYGDGKAAERISEIIGRMAC